MTDDERHDAMWGPGNWLVHEGCPEAAEAGQQRAAHHKDFHSSRLEMPTG